MYLFCNYLLPWGVLQVRPVQKIILPFSFIFNCKANWCQRSQTCNCSYQGSELLVPKNPSREQHRRSSSHMAPWLKSRLLHCNDIPKGIERDLHGHLKICRLTVDGPAAIGLVARRKSARQACSAPWGQRFIGSYHAR